MENLSSFQAWAYKMSTSKNSFLVLLVYPIIVMLGVFGFCLIYVLIQGIGHDTNAEMIWGFAPGPIFGFSSALFFSLFSNFGKNWVRSLPFAIGIFTSILALEGTHYCLIGLC